MVAIKYGEMDCDTLANVLRGKVEVKELEDLTGKVTHVGMGGASKSCYTSPNSGKVIYVLERNGYYAPDAYRNEVWQFDTDFTAAEAAAFLTAFDAKHVK